MELICPSCQQTLRVSDSDAGKQARCPKCQTVFSIPGGGGGADGGQGMAAAPGPTAGAGSDAGHWHLQIEDGRAFGPVPKAELDQWLAENRITANCRVRRDADPNWQPASVLYPQLGQPQGGGGPINPFKDQAAPNPYASHGGMQPAARGYAEPHRGAMILTFGILGLIICCCLFIGFSIAAWVMAAGDLKKMEHGIMDPEGKGLTLAGYIMGIIGVVLHVLGIALNIVMAAAG